MTMEKTNHSTAFCLTIIQFFLVAVIILLIGCTKNEEKQIEIGAILPLTGEGAKYGDSARKAINIAVKEINDQGGLRGKKVAIIYEDSQGDPKVGVAAVKKLISVDHVPAIIGDLLSSVTLSISPTANKSKVVILSPASSSPRITEAGDYVFRNCPSDVYEGSIMANFAYGKLNYRRVAVLFVNNEYGVGIKNVFERNFSRLGGKIVAKEAFDQNATDYRSQIVKVWQAKPEAIYLIGYKENGYILRQAKEMGIKVQFLSTVTFEDPDILKIAGNAAEGVIYTASTYDPKSDKKVIQNFVKAFKSEYNQDPDIFAGLSYDAMKILAIAMSQGGFTGESIKTALYNIKDYPGIAGQTNFDSNGDAILSPVLKTVVNNKFEFLK